MRMKMASRAENPGSQRKQHREKEEQLKRATKIRSDLKTEKKREKKGDDEEWEDVDEHEKDVFDKDGYFDVPEA